MKIPENFKGGFDLGKAMEQVARKNTRGSMLEFFFQLKTADLLVPCQGNDMNVAILTNSKEENFLFAFTNEEELRKTSGQWDRLILMKLDQLKHILIDQVNLKALVLNPFGVALELGRTQLEEIDSGTEGMSLKRTDYDEPQILSKLNTYPPGIKPALEKLLNNRPEVNRVWLVNARKKEEKKNHKLFVIEFEGDRRVLFPMVARNVSKFMNPGESFELMKADESLLKKVQAIGKPIYKSKLN